jgi:hypothetical protein
MPLGKQLPLQGQQLHSDTLTARYAHCQIRATLIQNGWMKSEISAVLKPVQLPCPQWHLGLTEGERTCLEDSDCFERPELSG